MIMINVPQASRRLAQPQAGVAQCTASCLCWRQSVSVVINISLCHVQWRSIEAHWVRTRQHWACVTKRLAWDRHVTPVYNMCPVHYQTLFYLWRTGIGLHSQDRSCHDVWVLDHIDNETVDVTTYKHVNVMTYEHRLSLDNQTADVIISPGHVDETADIRTFEHEATLTTRQC